MRKKHRLSYPIKQLALLRLHKSAGIPVARGDTDDVLKLLMGRFYMEVKLLEKE